MGGRTDGRTDGGRKACLASITHDVFRVPAGQVELKVSAEALKTDVLCGNEVAVVPATGRTDTVIRTLLVEVSHMVTAEL